MSATRAALVIALCTVGCAAPRPERRETVQVLDSVPDGAIVFRENVYDWPTQGSGPLGLPMDFALRDAALAGADAIVIMDDSIRDGRWFLRVMQIRLPEETPQSRGF